MENSKTLKIIIAGILGVCGLIFFLSTWCSPEDKAAILASLPACEDEACAPQPKGGLYCIAELDEEGLIAQCTDYAVSPPLLNGRCRL